MKIIKICICIIVVTLLSGCMTKSWVETHPSSHPGAIYTSEEYNITIIISPDTKDHKGTFVYNDETIDVVFSGIRLNSNVILMYTLENYESGIEETLARWRYVRLYKDKFIVESTAKTELFGEGDRITFYKTGDGSMSYRHKGTVPRHKGTVPLC